MAGPPLNPCASLPPSLQTFLEDDRSGDLFLSRTEVAPCAGLSATRADLSAKWNDSFDQIDLYGKADGLLSPEEVVHFDRLTGGKSTWQESVWAHHAWEMTLASPLRSKATRHAGFAMRYQLLALEIPTASVNAIFQVINSVTLDDDRLEIIEGLFELCSRMSPEERQKKLGNLSIHKPEGPTNGKLLRSAINRYRALLESHSNDIKYRDQLYDAMFSDFSCLANRERRLQENIQYLESVHTSEEDLRIYAEAMALHDYWNPVLKRLAVPGKGDGIVVVRPGSCVKTREYGFQDYLKSLGIVVVNLGDADNSEASLNLNFWTMRDLRYIHRMMIAAGLSKAQIKNIVLQLLEIKRKPQTRDLTLSSNDRLFNISELIDEMKDFLQNLHDNYGVPESELWATMQGILGAGEVWHKIDQAGTFLRCARIFGWGIDEVKDFCNRIRAANIDIGEVFFMFSNSLKDSALALRRKTPKDLADELAEIASRCGVRKFGRLSLKIIEALSAPRRPNHPLLMVNITNFDWNGAFYPKVHHPNWAYPPSKSIPVYSRIEDFIDEGYDVDLREVDGKRNIREHWKKVSGGKTGDVWLTITHGSEYGLQLSDRIDDDSELGTDDGETMEDIRPLLSADATVIVDTCEAAKKVDGRKNYAEFVNTSLGTQVWANPMEGSLYDVDFGADGIVRGVKFLGWKDDSIEPVYSGVRLEKPRS